jgi:hypothetical protein
MYPSVPHEPLLDALDRMFGVAMRSMHDLKGGDPSTYTDMVLKVATTKDGGAAFIKRPSAAALQADKKYLKSYILVDREKFMEMVTVLLRHSYVRFGNILVAQKVGIPIGTQAGPALANWYAFFYEFRYITDQHVIITTAQTKLEELGSRAAAVTITQEEPIEQVANGGI